jgi:hypothetical protein
MVDKRVRNPLRLYMQHDPSVRAGGPHDVVQELDGFTTTRVLPSRLCGHTGAHITHTW